MNKELFLLFNATYCDVVHWNRPLQLNVVRRCNESGFTSMSNLDRFVKTGRARKLGMTALAVASLGLGTIVATQPASAFGHGGGGGGGGGGHGGGFGGFHGGGFGGFHGGGFGGFHGAGFFRHGGFGGFRHGGFRHRGFGLDGGYYGDYYGCYRSVLTAYGYQTVDVCDY
jgi:hypothetical protein